MIESTSNELNGIDIMGSWVEVGMVIAAIIIGIFMSSQMLKSWYSKRKIKRFSPESKVYRSIHTRIHEFLTEVRIKVNADRALLLQFHNGAEFLDGTSIKRFSLTHESCVVGVSETRNSRQDIKISTFIEMLEHISLDKPTINVTSDLPDCHFKRHLETNHTLVYSLIPIKDVRGVLVLGCLLVEWCNWDNVDNIDDDKVLIEIPQYARYIESQLAMGR
jgi:hypothetical protein